MILYSYYYELKCLGHMFPKNLGIHKGSKQQINQIERLKFWIYFKISN